MELGLEERKRIVEDLVKRGSAVYVGEGVIKFTGNIDKNKLKEAEHAYAKTFYKLREEHERKEREAAIKNRDFVIVY